MTQDQDASLCINFPLLYRDRNGDARKTCMAFGFEVGSGWFDIIWELSLKLENFLKHNPDFSECRAFQVKEKFGTLRFYLEGPYSDLMEAYIRDAEIKSAHVCETCGQAGELQTVRGWIVTICDSCKIVRESRNPS